MAKSRAERKSHAAIDEDAALRQSHVEEEPPPFGGSWRTLYAAVLLNLAALVLLFQLFTRAFG
jgi:hypothetical protein